MAWSSTFLCISLYSVFMLTEANRMFSLSDCTNSCQWTTTMENGTYLTIRDIQIRGKAGKRKNGTVILPDEMPPSSNTNCYWFTDPSKTTCYQQSGAENCSNVPRLVKKWPKIMFLYATNKAKHTLTAKYEILKCSAAPPSTTTVAAITTGTSTSGSNLTQETNRTSSFWTETQKPSLTELTTQPGNNNTTTHQLDNRTGIIIGAIAGSVIIVLVVGLVTRQCVLSKKPTTDFKNTVDSVVIYETGEVTHTDGVYTLAEDVNTYAVPHTGTYDVVTREPNVLPASNGDVTEMVDNELYKSMNRYEPKMKENVLYHV